MIDLGDISYITQAIAEKRLSAQTRRRGIQAGKPIFLTVADPEAPRGLPPRQRTPAEIRELRTRLGLTQKQFATALNVHGDTVKKYESESDKSTRPPSNVCLRLMEVIERNPEVIQECTSNKLFTGEAIVAIRKSFKVSQNIFAGLLGVTRESVCSWEQNQRHVSCTAARLLQVVLDFPELILPESIASPPPVDSKVVDEKTDVASKATNPNYPNPFLSGKPATAAKAEKKAGKKRTKQVKAKVPQSPAVNSVPGPSKDQLELF
jgi:DNA-binding transcriptional regulator YiaG